LVEILSDLSGLDTASVDSSTSFLEMGFDSLFLTQFTVALHNKFGLKITFRELLGDESTLDALTQYIDSKVPAELFDAGGAAPLQAPPPTVPSTPGTELNTLMPAAPDEMRQVSTSSVERLMRDQLQAMNELFAKQLDAVRGVTINAA